MSRQQRRAAERAAGKGAYRYSLVNTETILNDNRLLRLRDGRCPIHGLALRNSDDLIVGVIAVQCPRRDCTIRGRIITIDGGISDGGKIHYALEPPCAELIPGASEGRVLFAFDSGRRWQRWQRTNS